MKDVNEAKLARIEMIKRGIVLKKQTRIRNIHPVVFLARSSAGDRLRFSQIYSRVKQCRKRGREYDVTILTISFGLGANVIVVPLTRFDLSMLATICAYGTAAMEEERPSRIMSAQAPEKM